MSQKISSLLDLLTSKYTLRNPKIHYQGFSGVSHMSNVYSYGILGLNLVGCRKSINVCEKRSSELYVPHWIYKQFELKKDHETLEISNEEEKLLQRKLVTISLWCIQTHPSNQPFISRAVEMLAEDLESLEIPPMPSLSSSPKPYGPYP
ncbi:Protein SUPPRESSOR OF NPR1-1 CONSTITUTIVE 4 [Bienertia sinuspersici]